MGKREISPELLSEALRQGVVYGIRRADLDLLKTCINRLWKKERDRIWLQWKLPRLVASEAYYLAGECRKWRIDSLKYIRQAYYTLALVPKNRDVAGISGLYILTHWFGDRKHEGLTEQFKRVIDYEFLLSKKWIDIAIEKGLGAATEDLYKHLASKIEPSGFFNLKRDSFNKAILDSLYRVATEGGSTSDRRSAICSLVIAGRRPIHKKRVMNILDESKERYKKPTEIDVPWYCYDLHTTVGLNALKKACQKIYIKNMDYEVKMMAFGDAWDLLEYCKVHPGLLILKKRTGRSRPSIIENVWWAQFVRTALSSYTMSAKDLANSWRAFFKPYIKKRIARACNI